MSLALARMSHVPRIAVAMLILGLLFVHQLEVWVFGFGYYALTSDGDYGLLVGREIRTVIGYVYFSLVTYTTLGYGDIIPVGPIRFISAAEALTGMVLIAWSASFTFLEMQRFWKVKRVVPSSAFRRRSEILSGDSDRLDRPLVYLMVQIRFLVFATVLSAVGAALAAAAYPQSFVPPNAQLAELLAEKDFAELERLAAQIRNEQPKSADGLWESDRFYGVLSRAYEGNDEGFADRIAAWERAYPDSIAWRIVVARTYYHLVVPQGRVLQRSYLGSRSRRLLSRAWRIVEDGRALEQNDVALYPTAIQIGQWVGVPRSRTVEEGPLIVGRDRDDLGANNGESNDRRILETLLAESESLQPGYAPSYEARAVTLLPQNGAPEGAVERFALDARDAHGDAMYARIALAVLTATGLNAYSDTFRFSWEHIEAGFVSILNEYPRSSMYRNYYCFMACMYMDRETARGLFDELGNEWERRLWGGYYDRWRGWANNEAAYPITR